MYVVRMHRTVALMSDQKGGYAVQVGSDYVLVTDSYTKALGVYQDEKQKLPRQLNI